MQPCPEIHDVFLNGLAVLPVVLFHVQVRAIADQILEPEGLRQRLQIERMLGAVQILAMAEISPPQILAVNIFLNSRFLIRTDSRTLLTPARGNVRARTRTIRTMDGYPRKRHRNGAMITMIRARTVPRMKLK